MSKGNPVVTLTSPKDHYFAEACIVWCFDDRFKALLGKFIETRGYRHPDTVIVAGGAKDLASPTQKSDRRYILEQIDKSIRLHKPPLIILMTHSDCGAYGSLKAFDNDPDAERTKHKEELQRAAEVVRGHVPAGINVETVFADFEGLHSL